MEIAVEAGFDTTYSKYECRLKFQLAGYICKHLKGSPFDIYMTRVYCEANWPGSKMVHKSDDLILLIMLHRSVYEFCILLQIYQY